MSEVLKEKAEALGRKHLKAIAHDINDELVPEALNIVKEKIPGQIDDVLVETLKPVLKAALAELIEKI